MEEHLYPQSGNEDQLTTLPLNLANIQIYENIVAWKLYAGGNGSDPSEVEVWDWREGRRIWVCSHDYFGSYLSTDWSNAPLFQHSPQNAEDSFTLLDGMHIVHMCRTDRHLLVENFGGQNGEERSLGLFLEIPSRYTASTISASSIPSPPSQHPQPFWTDPALRVVVVRMSTEDAALQIGRAHV